MFIKIEYYNPEHDDWFQKQTIECDNYVVHRNAPPLEDGGEENKKMFQINAFLKDFEILSVSLAKDAPVRVYVENSIGKTVDRIDRI